MLLRPEHLTVIAWRYLTVRIISKWNEMYPDMQLDPNVGQDRPVSSNFIAVDIAQDGISKLVVWGYRLHYQPDDYVTAARHMQTEEWIKASQTIVDEDLQRYYGGKELISEARHADLVRWLRDRQRLARSKSEHAAALRKLLPELELCETILNLRS